jgi:hypothetical protein
MKTLILLGVAAAGGALCGCGDKAAETPKQFAPPPKVGASGALHGAQAPAGPTAPAPARSTKPK